MVDGGRFVAVGRDGRGRGAAGGDAGRRRRGKTIMPAMIDAHAHIGYMRDLTSGPQNYTRENIVDHLQRYAYFGVAAAQAMGSDFTDLPYQLRDESGAGRVPDAARFLTAGRGLAPPDEVRPDNMRHSAYRITTEPEARAAVAELADRGVAIVKTWVDDRGGAVRKLTPELYGAIIDEAHRRGLRVMVHATSLDDAKALLRAGVDGFGHAFQDVDDELLGLMKARPQVFFLLALGGPRRVVSAPWLNPVHPLVQETVSPAQIARLQQRLARQTPEERERARAAWDTDGGGHRPADRRRRADRRRHRWRRADRRSVRRLDRAHRGREHGGRRDDAGPGTDGRDAQRGRHPRPRRPRHHRAGKSADFVVLDANPLDDITNTRRIAQVYLRGRAVDRAGLRARWTGAGGWYRSHSRRGELARPGSDRTGLRLRGTDLSYCA